MNRDIWRTKTWNPIIGRSAIKKDWAGKIEFCKHRLEQPLHWRKPQRIFVCNMGDIFHEQARMVWLNKVFDIIYRCKQHTFLVLTKRPKRMAEEIACQIQALIKSGGYENLWLGVTVENQQRADERIPLLLQIPAAHRFISAEPLLSPLNFKKIHIARELKNRNANWLVLGCDTGPNPHLCSIEDMINVACQCSRTGVPLFVKAVPIAGKPCRDITKFPKELQRRELP